MMRASLSLFFAAVLALAQAPSDRVNALAKELADAAGQAAMVPTIREPFASRVDQSAFAGFAAAALMDGQIHRNGTNAQFYQSLMDIMEASVGKQVGATPSTKGTTSLAMKGGVPQILGLAVEHGAIAQEVDGNSVTFRATPAGIVKALEGQDIGTILKAIPGSNGSLLKGPCDWCDRFSGSVTFDISRGPTPGTLTASKQQVSAWSARMELVNQRNPRLRRYFQEFQKLANDHGAEYINARNALSEALAANAAYKAWNAKLVQDVANKVDKPFAAKTLALNDAKQKFIEVVGPAIAELSNQVETANAIQAPIKAYALQLSALIADRSKILEIANRGLLITADWSVVRDPNVPDLSTVTGVLETSAGPGHKHDFTLNVAGAFYNSSPAAPARQFHDFKATAQYDIPLGSLRSYGPFVFSLGGRYEYIPRDVLSANAGLAVPATTAAPAGAAISPKGNMAVGQAKLTIPVKGSGVKIPLSVTVANRTELIKEKDVRANIGITFDLDAIFARAATTK